MKQSLLLLALTVFGAAPALAQHETGSDVESGARAYAASCATCHGPDGNLIAGIDFGRGVFRRPLTDREIVSIIQNGIPNTPMPPMATMSDTQAGEIVAYLRSLPDTLSETDAIGDPVRGQQIIAERGECMDCHRIGDGGSHLGPNLSRVGRDRRAVEIEQSLLDPQAEIQPQNRFVEVSLRRGDPIEGRLLNQDTFSIQLMDADQRLRSIDKTNVAGIQFIQSPMPSFADRFDAQELADVVSFLVSLR